MAKYVQSVASVALVGAAVQTLIQITANSGKRLRVTEVGISFDGVSASAVPALVDLLRQTGGTGSSGSLLKMNEAEAAALASSKITFTVEPTAGDILRRWFVSPNGGLFVWQPAGELWVAASGLIALRANAPANVNCTAYVEIDE